MKEHILNLEGNRHASPRTQRLPKMYAKRSTPRHIIIKIPKVKDKERILKAAREKQLVTYRGVPL